MNTPTKSKKPAPIVIADAKAILKMRENYLSVMTGVGYIIPEAFWKRIRRVASHVIGPSPKKARKP